MDDSGLYMALGYAGQFIFVVPDKEMVVVFTSDLSDDLFFVPQQLLESIILPAAESPVPLPPNPDGVARLQTAIQQAAQGDEAK